MTHCVDIVRDNNNKCPTFCSAQLESRNVKSDKNSNLFYYHFHFSFISLLLCLIWIRFKCIKVRLASTWNMQFILYISSQSISGCVCVCHMAGRTVRSPCYTRATTEHFGDQALLIEQGLTSHQTHYRSYRGRAFTGQMTQPIVSEH